MIALIDYGRGNLASVANALNYLDAPFRICTEADELRSCSGMILPGVGAFDDAVKALRRSGMEEAIRESVSAGRQLLGICLGMQLLFERSDEGVEPGLGLLAGEVRSLRAAFPVSAEAKVPHGGWNSSKVPHMGGSSSKVPHMGWNQLLDCRDPYLREGSEMYFVHSFYVAPNDEAVSAAFCHYEIDFTAAVLQNNLRAYQFHPEKSGAEGLKVLERFVAGL